MKVLVLGGYGVFGGRLARMLVEDGHVVIVAGRRRRAAESFAAKIGAEAAVMDLAQADLVAEFRSRGVEVVVDAAGPFQAYVDAPYRVAEAAIAAGVHYFDLSDDGTFTAGIDRLDHPARDAAVAVVSGVSSVPALSSAAVGALTRGLTDLQVIEAAICPGNRAPRGRSVMAAILAQVGAPIAVWRGGCWQTVTGWSGRRSVRLGGGLVRPASYIGAPDLVLFPERYRARSVLFRAGLQLAVMQRGMEAMSWLRARGWVPDLQRFIVPLLWAAKMMGRFGTDRGGMAVEVFGRTASGQPEHRVWRVRARAGEGPMIPAIPGRILVGMLATGTLAPGARAAVEVFDLEAAEAGLARLATTVERIDRPAPRLFEGALGDRWERLPGAVRRLHDLWDEEVWTGTGEVTCATQPLARLVAWLFGFPRRSGPVAVSVRLTRTDWGELWRRDFGGQRFLSRLSPARAGHVTERFGPFWFELALTGDDTWLGLRAVRGWLGPIPLPDWVMPVSEGREWEENGRFCFDVPIELPGFGLVVRYRGALERS